jgi:hypothetical protein
MLFQAYHPSSGSDKRGLGHSFFGVAEPGNSRAIG